MVVLSLSLMSTHNRGVFHHQFPIGFYSPRRGCPRAASARPCSAPSSAAWRPRPCASRRAAPLGAAGAAGEAGDWGRGGHGFPWEKMGVFLGKNGGFPEKNRGFHGLHLVKWRKHGEKCWVFTYILSPAKWKEPGIER